MTHRIKLDEKNCKILELLQKDCRLSLTDIAKKIGLSVDSTKKRIDKMNGEIFFPRIQLRPRHFGYNNVVDIRIKMHNHDEKDINEFIDYLKSNPYVVEIISTSGPWNLSIVLIAKDALDLGVKTDVIKKRFGRIISEWVESLTTKVYKFEEYDMKKLIEKK